MGAAAIVVVIVLVIEALNEALVDGGGLGGLPPPLGLGLGFLFLERGLFGGFLELRFDVGEFGQVFVCIIIVTAAVVVVGGGRSGRNDVELLI